MVCGLVVVLIMLGRDQYTRDLWRYRYPRTIPPPMVDKDGHILNYTDLYDSAVAKALVGIFDEIEDYPPPDMNKEELQQRLERLQKEKDEVDKKYNATWKEYFGLELSAVSEDISEGGKQAGEALSIFPKALDHLRTLPEFPKKIHLFWPDKAVAETGKDHEMVRLGLQRLIDLNPDWAVQVHDNADVYIGIEKFDHPEFPAELKSELLNGAHIIEQTDLFRLIVIYEQGGIYIDMDRAVNIPLEEVLNTTHTKLLIPTLYDTNFSQDLFGSSPGNELVLNIMRRRWERQLNSGEGAMLRKQGWLKDSDVMELSNIHTESLTLDLFGRTLEEKDWEEARRAMLNGSENLIVTKKDMWCDGLLIRDFDGCKEISRDSLYRAYNVTNWSDVVKAVWAAN